MSSFSDIFDTISGQLSRIGESCLLPNDTEDSTETSTTPTVACAQILTTLSAIRYGCYILRIGDQDDSATRTRVWGGNATTPPFSICPVVAETPATPEEAETPEGDEEEAPAPAVPTPEHVKQLQEDLRALGFALVGTPDGDFGRKTEQAVREFQIYAGMEYIARVKASAPATQRVDAHLAAQLGPTTATTLSQYVDSLEQVCNNARYTGPISGFTNDDTRRCIQHWIDNLWRCPVVIEAWNIVGGARGTLYRNAANVWAVNIWSKDDPGTNAPRVFFRDFTTHYTYPAGRNRTDMHALGQYSSYSTWGGPVSLPPRHIWSEAEVLTANLTGVATPTGNTLSTFKVVRASSEVECVGYFDSVNSYDNAVASVGPCHWVFAFLNSGNNNVGAGEMGAFISYFQHSQATDFQTAIERFGLRAHESWTNAAGTGNGSTLWSAASRKYVSYFSRQNDANAFVQIPSDKRDYVYYQCWHWFFRFVMAGRTVSGYQRAMWDMARIRVRDIRATPWGVSIHGHADLTIGDVFTSERATAMLLRAHIRYPAHVVNTNAGKYLRGQGTTNGALAMAEAETPAQAGTGNTAGNTLDWTVAPSTWTNNHEAALVRGLTRSIEAFHPTPASGNVPGIRTTVRTVHNWPTWSLTGTNPRNFALAKTFTSGGLSANRSSFDFKTTGLPPAV